LYTFLELFENKVMKKLLIISILIIPFISCEKIDKFTQFTWDINTTFFIDQDLPTETLIYLEPQSVFIDNGFFEDYNSSKELIEEAKIKDLFIEMDNPAEANFNFLSDIEIYLEADGLPKVRIAWKNDIEDLDSQKIKLNFLSDNLAEYLKKDKLKISATIKTNESLDYPVTIKLKASFFVDANVMGV
jgi:hypothetical protein